MEQKLLFITPPFTQLNTPYPATAYLKGFMNTLHIESHQCDLGIEVILKLFCSEGLKRLFKEVEKSDLKASENADRICALQSHYIDTIDPVIRFLQNKNPTLAHSICDKTYLPEANRFAQLDDLDWAFGTMGIHDKARHFATLYLEDLGDLIQEIIDPHFGFSRYAEHLATALSDFEEMNQILLAPNTLISEILQNILEDKITKTQANVVCLSVPFPGNLFAALKCGQYLKKNHPHIKIIMGGGYPNTELRRLEDPRFFDYVDFVCLDDGEAPLQILLEHLAGKRKFEELKRVFTKHEGKVRYFNQAKEKDIAQRLVGTPDYSDLFLHDYLSVIEIVNPMHRLWSDGRWNKLTLAHGCYWGKCSFCDISLSYIKDYEPVDASLLCDRIEEIINQTGQNGFHFVDEAAPPALMRDLAMEIIRRKLTVTWWTNIRFEKSFTIDLCSLLKTSGCIAVSGGLEVASDRLLGKMKKGVTVAQVARVADAFTQAGIMVHAYLMYGFPTQTALETIDSLEMVRQLFLNGVIQSGFWHRFAMTAHSPVGLHPKEFGVQKIGPAFAGFADNDLFHEDPDGCNHALFSEGLKKSLFNYMHGIGFELSLSEWFDFKTPITSIPRRYIEQVIDKAPIEKEKKGALVFWPYSLPQLKVLKGKKKNTIELHFHQKQSKWVLKSNEQIGFWLKSFLDKTQSNSSFTLNELRSDFEAQDLGSFPNFKSSYIWQELRKNGLLIL